MDATIRLREGQLRKFRAMTGLERDTELAARMGVTRQTVHRIVAQRAGLSPGFIAALLTAFPHLTFDDLFEVAPSDTEPEEVGVA